MEESSESLWNSIHYRATPSGKPTSGTTRTRLLELIEAGFPRTKSGELHRISDTVSIEVNSRPPSEASSTSEDEEEWEDVEPDVEAITFKSLIDLKPFNNLQDLCRYDREVWKFDLISVKKRLELDFHESVKLVNYVRSKAKEGFSRVTEPKSKSVFGSEEYLRPVLEDDALLFSLEDLEADMDMDLAQDPSNLPENNVTSADKIRSYTARIAELEIALQRSREAFLETRTIDKEENTIRSTVNQQRDAHDRFYFNSYAARDIHEEMLKDSARTDAYRDFIYGNKHLFEGKIVLDVGCGTGILSLMCARAGAKHVFAVDNSAIIDKAREIAFVNGLQDVVTCVHGLVEEISLPVPKVDIIVSEWMGYALLYEAMLDSVIFARDKWLCDGGLMIPSEITLHMALLADPELIVDKSDFWADVYGFDMNVMRKGVFDGAIVEPASKAIIPSDLSHPDGSNKILHLDLHKAIINDLTFHTSFCLRLDREVDALDGFVLWFDAIFGRNEANNVVHKLSTGPLAKRTHWQQAKLVIDRKGDSIRRISSGVLVEGSVEYSRPSNEHRNLEITIQWSVEASQEKGIQHWRIDY